MRSNFFILYSRQLQRPRDMWHGWLLFWFLDQSSSGPPISHTCHMIHPIKCTTTSYTHPIEWSIPLLNQNRYASWPCSLPVLLYVDISQSCLQSIICHTPWLIMTKGFKRSLFKQVPLQTDFFNWKPSWLSLLNFHLPIIDSQSSCMIEWALEKRDHCSNPILVSFDLIGPGWNPGTLPGESIYPGAPDVQPGLQIADIIVLSGWYIDEVLTY